MNMKEISIAVNGLPLDYETSRQIALAMARKDNEDTSLMAWYDKKANKHSPAAVECDADYIAGWEEYGRNHGGKLKILFNGGEYVFIYS